ncbi:putative endonuclease [Rhodobium orientis]|nr:putative endonuclease [Rhodobium orientis]
MTTDLRRRVQEHREEQRRGFTKAYRVKRLVHYEHYDRNIDAIQREKNIKHWPRQWKMDLVEAANPKWRDLWNDIASP